MRTRVANWRALGLAAGALLLGLLASSAQALPVFARQTGQNCVACHTGGQFPELTPYGRMFKMTGYTIGERTMPLAVMGVVSAATVANSDAGDGLPTSNSNSGFYQNGSPIIGTLSLFIAGKVTDNVGAFLQVTHDPNASPNADGSVSGHTVSDNMDLRWADRLVDEKRDLIYGVSLNNHPSLSDPWNTAAAWMQYVPTASPGSQQFIDGTVGYPGFGASGNVAGVTAYAYWNKTLYGELGYYATADNAFRIFSAGTDDASLTRLQGVNPYWRLAYTTEWGANNLMLGATGMQANVFDGANDFHDSGSYNQVSNLGLDAQYQYILDPHTVTVQLASMQQVTNYSPNFIAGNAGINNSDTLTTVRAKVAYTYQAKYGGSFSVFNVTGTTDAIGYGTFTGDPSISGMTYELFYTPIQNLRLGAQYTAYSQYDGAANNYDGNGRNASDNNTLYLYAWFAF